ncbi:MAG: serine/threonine protein kinase [Deltaproteobacteria bacterium]|nr:serine/threonine protein kinase [Deltaproteobacteria bacterium]
MKHAVFSLGLTLSLALSLALSVNGCGSSFAMTAPDGFVELDEDNSNYDARFTSADGVVISVRAIEHDPEGDLAFWVEAIESRVRMNGGYALLDTKEISAASGQTGTQLRFGRDQNGTPFKYWISIFVTEGHLHIVEAGGRTEQFDAAEARVERAIENLELR